MKRKFTKYPVMGSSMTQEFMKYHDSAENYNNNKDGFNQMYTILDQYGSDDEDVDVVFDRATEEDKKRMLELIKPITAASSQERGTVETFRNRRNPNKYIEVKKGNDGHSYARQYLKWDTPDGEVKNYMGARTSRGRYFRSRRDTIDQMLEDYDPVECANDYLSLKYTFYFGDGNSAASRGTESENDCVVSGTVSFDEFASAAVSVLNDLPDGFIDSDILDLLYDQGYDASDVEDLQSRSLEDAIANLDISGGEPLVYKVEKNGQVVYHDKDMEELVKAGRIDDDEADDEDEDYDEYYD